MGGEGDGSVVLACPCRPSSVNNATGKGRERFGVELKASWENAGRPRREGLLYGAVCWFTLGYHPSTDPDADNISKGVWDALSDAKPGNAASRCRLGAFADDKQVRVRVAGILDLGSGGGAPGLSDRDLGGLPAEVVRRLESMANGAGAGQHRDEHLKHLTYIRFGRLSAATYNLSLLGGAP